MPWKRLSLDFNYEFILVDSLPEDTFLMDPSKFQQSNIDEFLRHWVKRQKANSQGLVFLKAGPGHMREPRPTLAPTGTAGRKEKDDNCVDIFNENVEEEASGSSHPDSPAAHAMSVDSRMAFLRSLSQDVVYIKFVRLLESREEVSILILVVLHCI